MMNIKNDNMGFIKTIKIIATALLIYVPYYSIGQSSFDFINYRKYYNKAEMAMYHKNFQVAKKYYSKAFKYGNNITPNRIDYWNYAICFTNTNDTTSAVKYIEKSLSMGAYTYANDNNILELLGNKQGSIVIGKLPKFKQEYENNILDKENSSEINALEKADQYIRNNKENIADKEYERLLLYSDSVNFNKLYQLVKYKNANPICFLLYHLYGNNKKYFTFYDSIFKSKIYTGETSPDAYVQWHDRQRVYVDQFETQLYGEFNDFMKGDGKFQPIEDVKNVDKRRFSLGLCSLQDYALMNHLKLPKDYVIPSKKFNK